jgi:hypothetical protein
MPHTDSTDFFFEVSRGHVPGHSPLVIDSRLPVVGIADGMVDIWAGGGDLDRLEAAELVEIVSTDAADVRILGSGARTVLIEGLGAGYELQSETVELLGTGTAVTALAYLRVLRMVSLTTGAGHINAGDITATAATAGTVQCQLAQGKSVSENSQFTVPDGQLLRLIRADINVVRLVGGGNISSMVVVESFEDVAGSEFARHRELEVQIDTGMGHFPGVEFVVGGSLAARTDIRIQAGTDKDNTEVRCRLCGVLYDEGIQG